MQAKLQEQLSPDAEVILGRLPERIKAIIARAAKIEDPIAISIANFQGHRSIRFCRLQTRTRAVKSRSPRRSSSR